jgi:3-hydroxyisobutyrate dehydrogenase
MSKPRIAFFGLGLMGSGMARQLLKSGFPVTVFNRSREKATALATEGAMLAECPRNAATGADFVVSMVADDGASRSTWLGDQGALAGAKRGAVLIESSTLTVGWVGELAATATACGCELLDAPVTGSKTHAAAGELNFLVGGSPVALEKARPVLEAMSRSMIHIGPTGSGALLKLINNFLCGVQAASLAEALALIERSGLDSAKALEVLTTGAPGSPLVKTLSARMVERKYAPMFLLPLMAKDLTYALDEGKKHSVELVTAAAALELFQHALDAGAADTDFSAVVEQFRPARK